MAEWMPTEFECPKCGKLSVIVVPCRSVICTCGTESPIKSRPFSEFRRDVERSLEEPDPK